MQDSILEKRPAVIVDLDGTLCDIWHRFHLFRYGKFVEFDRAMKDDTPNFNVVDFIHMQRIKMNEILFVTGRRETYRTITRNWLAKYLPGFDQFPLFMREDDDERDDAIVKREIYFSFIEPFYHIGLVLEDRSTVVDMWRNLGFECWQVGDGDY